MKQRFFLCAIFLLAGALTIFLVTLAKQFLPAERLRMIVAWQYAFLVAVGMTLALGFFRRFRSRALLEILFTAMLFLGVWFAAFLVLPPAIALLAAAGLTLGSIFFRRVWMHDLFSLVGAAGAAINVADWLSPELLLAVLVCFTVYDMVVGPPGDPIATLAHSLASSGIVPCTLVPSRFADLRMAVHDAIRKNVAFLGAGDVLLPLTLVARAAFYGLLPSLIVLAGLLAGTFVALRRQNLPPRAALPALAAGTAIPFLALRFFSVI
ncbi:MAG: presenilin family intramembrane aspartyl protease [Patescibacteria group bacterium]|mgnify:FL=1